VGIVSSARPAQGKRRARRQRRVLAPEQGAIIACIEASGALQVGRSAFFAPPAARQARSKEALTPEAIESRAGARRPNRRSTDGPLP